ncbi:doublecortin domain-containing protein 2 [Spea bombifrons]|uniref:doublecortin domain-containing protein 2 n=1 Tax=Spea bombifrons TaxID=233779 RepID=UPI00234A8B36|nr:doublecortin domain-containing protein 2 [Spea bombifrons]
MQPAQVAGGGGRTLAPLAQQPAVKAVHVYRNGDPFFRGRRMLIHEKRVGTFEVFLKDVTGGVQAPFGAVRNLYTPRNGHRITSLEDLQPGECYVAGGRETFKKMDYLHIGEIKKRPVDPLSQVKPVSHSRINVSARFRKIVQEPCTIFLIANGDTMNPVVRLLIPRRILEQWELVLAMVTEKVRLRNGAVHRLYTLEGTPIQDGSELENGQFYVAVGREKFKKLPYNDLIFSKSSVRRAHGSKASSLPPINGFRKSKENRHERQTKSTGGSTDTVDNIISPQPPKAKEKKKHEPQILTKPVQVRLNNGQLVNENYPDNDDGIFKASEDRSEMWGASEVQEDENTKVEVPVDQRVAETVEEEEKANIDNADEDANEDEAVAEAEEEDTQNNIIHEDANEDEAEVAEETEDAEGHSMAEYSLPRPTSSRLLEKVSTPSEAEKNETNGVA